MNKIGKMLALAVALLLAVTSSEAQKPKVVRNKKGGYSIRVPGNWTVGTTDESTYITSDHGQIMISVSPMYSPIKACEQLTAIEALYEGKRVNQIPEAERASNANIQKAVGVKDGCHARYQVSDEYGSQNIEFAVFTKGKKIYQIEVKHPTDNPEASNQLIEAMRTFTLK